MMKLIRDAIRLPFTWPYVAVIMGLWLVVLSEKPSSTSRVVGQQIKKTDFKLFTFYSYIILYNYFPSLILRRPISFAVRK